MSYRRFITSVLKKAFLGPWQIADGVAGIIGIVGSILAWFLPQFSSYVVLATWLIPLALFAPISIYRLAMAPYWVLKDELKEVDKSLVRLKLIDESKPRIIFDSVRDAQLYRESPISEGKRRIFRLHQIWFKNTPLIPSERSVGLDVSSIIEFISESDPTCHIKVYGQWMIGNPPDFVASGDIASEIRMPPSHLPYKLNVVLKFEQDSWVHAFSRESLTRDLDGRDSLTGLSPGKYKVLIHLKGVGVDENFKFALENPGVGHSLHLYLEE